MRIMKRRMTSVKYSSGHFTRISSCMCVKGTMCRHMGPQLGTSSRASSITFSLAASLV